ncbi:MAG: XdhC/CoxI family protein [Eubacteriales bacterium]|nr:XdhC/CoxI family protein [Eubacteriales bacterium]
MTQQEILIEQLKAGKSKKNYAVATIIKAEGSTPRESGKMLVFADGKTIGTVGGGRVERMAAADAVACIASGANACKEYTLLEEGSGIGMSCGGNVTMFIEVYRVKPQLIMCGAGHVGGALIKLAQFCGYDVTLVDTRPDEYIQDKIELADTFVHVEDFYQGVKELDVPEGCCFVIATFGHAYDGEALEAALSKNASYVGMVGSKRKVGTLFASLREKGFTKEQLDNVYTPIGLDIGSETPEEIALSVMAEIMQLKKGSSAKHLRDCDHK